MNTLTRFLHSLRARGFVKQANILETLFPKNTETELVTQCPICGSEGQEGCLLCDGSGELVSALEDDQEDIRIQKELAIK
jgi:hypothetical protein